MRCTRLAAVAAALLLVGAASLRAQEPPPPAGPEQRTLGLPPEVGWRVVELYNRPTTLHFTGRTRIPAGQVIRGDVAVLAGSLVVAGRVEGSVAVINGDATLLPGASITGDLTVVGGEAAHDASAVVEGSVEVHRQRLYYRRDGERLALRSPPRSTTPRRAERTARRADEGRAEFMVASGQSYNRVEGLPIVFGPVLETGGAYPLRLRALAVYRTEAGLSLDTDRMGYYVRADQLLSRTFGLRVGGTFHSVIEAIEDWQVSNLESGLATFVLHRDHRDHYEREGWSLFADLELPGRPLTLGVEGRRELHRSVAAGNPWSLFRNAEPWRPQPLVGEGRLSALAVSAALDTRDRRRDPSTGWYVRGELERSLEAELMRPAGVFADTLAAGGFAVLPSEPLPGFQRGFVDIRRYNRTGPDARLNLRLLAGGSLDGSPLPPQRQHALGGAGTLPGYRLFSLDCGARASEVLRADELPPQGSDDAPRFVPAYGCDAFTLLQAEMRGRLGFRFRWDGDPWGDRPARRGTDAWWISSPDWVVFVDAMRGWSYGSGHHEELAVDVGTGILLDRVGLYLAYPLRGSGGLNLFIRLSPRF
jgi:hypothetical protein